MNAPTVANRILLGAIVAGITLPCYLELAGYFDFPLWTAGPRMLIAVCGGMVVLVDRIFVLTTRKYSN